MKYKKIVAIIIACILVCGIGGYVVYAASVIKIDPDQFYKVISVMDGDTFKVDFGRHEVTVRMLGIDTPETIDPRKKQQCFGKEASDETKLLLTGKSVRLKLNPDREEKDKFRRYLAYVYGEDGMFVNEYLLQNGFAREYTYGKPYQFQNYFRGIQEHSQKEKKGLWGECINATK